jgi:putative peptidoglycan lipid II flippase
VLAVLLHQRRMVSLASLDYAEMGRCLLAALAGGAGVWVFFTLLPGRLAPLLGMHVPTQSRWFDLAVLVAGSAVWVVIAKWVLERTGSALPEVAMKQLGLR